MKDPLSCVRNLFEAAVTKGFDRYGRIVGKYPWPFFILPIIMTCLCACGFSKFVEIQDVLDTFTPKGAESRYETWVQDHFFDKDVNLTLTLNDPYEGRRKKRAAKLKDYHGLQTVQLDMELRDEGDIYGNKTDWILNTIDYFHNKFYVEYKGNKYKYSDFCDPFCPTNDRAKIFLKMLRDSYGNDNPNVKLIYPTIEVFGNIFYIGDNIFGIKTKKNKNVKSCKMVHTMFHYVKDDANKKYVALWEKEIVKKIMRNNIRHLNLVTGHPDGVFAEVRRTGLAVLPLMGPCATLLLAFSILSNMKSDCRRSNIWESLAGLICPGMAIVASFGILLYSGLAYQHIVSTSLFLVVAVGVDDMYIMLHSWHQTDPHLPVHVRMGEAMSHAGPSITITSLTNALSFGVGILTPTSAVKTFCAYTSLCMIMDYLFQTTYFAAVMVFAGRREADNRNSLICCVSNENRECTMNVFKWIGRMYKKTLKLASKAFITKKARIILLIVMIIYLIIGIIGIIQTTIDITIRKIVLEDSPLHRVEYFRQKYFLKEANEIRIYVLHPGNLENGTTRQKAKDFVKEFEDYPQFVKGSTSFWLRPYSEYLSFFNDSEDYFTYKFINSFLDTANNDYWKQYLNYDPNLCEKHNCLYKWSFSLTYRDLEVWHDRANMYKQLRTLVKKPEYKYFNTSIFSWTNYGADQIGPVISTTRNLVLLTLIFMVIVCFFFVPNLTSILCAALSVISICIGVYGYLMLWNTDMDPISMAALLMAIGFSVDYTAHMSYHYFKAPQEDPEERLLYSYNAIGWPMLQASLSTLICSGLMVLHRSYMVRTFIKTVFLVEILGLAHSLIVLPIVLVSITIYQQNRAKRLEQNKNNDNFAELPEMNRENHVKEIKNGSAGDQNIDDVDKTENSNSHENQLNDNATKFLENAAEPEPTVDEIGENSFVNHENTNSDMEKSEGT